MQTAHPRARRLRLTPGFGLLPDQARERAETMVFVLIVGLATHGVILLELRRGELRRGELRRGER